MVSLDSNTIKTNYSMMGQSKEIQGFKSHTSVLADQVEEGALSASSTPWPASHLVRLNFCTISLVLFGELQHRLQHHLRPVSPVQS